MSLSPGPCARASVSARAHGHARGRVEGWGGGTHPAYADAEVDERVDGVLFGEREARVLVQAAAVLVGDALAVLDVERDDADLVRVAGGEGGRGQRASGQAGGQAGGEEEEKRTTDMTSRLSSSGTISSTRCFGDFPSAVTPVEQFFRRAARRGGRCARQRVSESANQHVGARGGTVPARRSRRRAACRARRCPCILGPC